ncbi:DUF4291 domain-containing protein [Streptomyces caniscabiei]|uniref:DUF4291 domain-containing protein n=1 Tax=Streptomyces caniscabiei TaxID=2746961 RepID=A0A927QJC8_9ACTN|nr:DUF4291 domain-containing protein [Streptomyces caniscabiei]MBD9703939.1 DUF4291 domain-containing protein [Streptomyces caniscabiei]MBD9727950.1 DUF4291 domain-containing protein [Streptomyces caniscabiei]MDX3513373.1 DUF4291 domain-containing protein [Streptomyces caniscabiei]MDX3722493.1 DUF4291 domain-containing protein [Streptomyces caniscabiei]MDX3732369.1 DUF4291 domain-containing protein [Streptomyces caniscabiei]
MAPPYEIRADHDARTIVVYQAYAPAIADAALRAGRFVEPFSFRRMTWIKPSFLWLMHRSNWARKPGQERVLAVRITRAGWEEALSRAVPTTADPAAVARADVHVQWDPERSARGAALNHYSIQVGIGRRLIRTFTDEWVVGLTDLTPQVRKAAALMQSGQTAKAQRLFPPERVYPLPPALDAPRTARSGTGRLTNR